MIRESLLKIGLDEDETSIYLACLELAESTIADISKKSGCPRTTCYLVTSRLKEKGLLSQTQRGSRTYFALSSPENLKALTIEKEEEAKNQRKLADRLIPMIIDLSPKERGPKIQYFSGRNGIRAIFEDMLTSGATKDFYIGSTENLVEIVGKEYMRNWMHRRVKAGIFSYGIRVKSGEMPVRAFRPSRKMMREVRYAPEGYEFPLYLCVYANKVALISSKKECYGQIIESEDFVSTIKSLFDILWKLGMKV